MNLVIHLSKQLPTVIQILAQDGRLEIETTICRTTTINLTALTRGTYRIRCSNYYQTTTGRILKN